MQHIQREDVLERINHDRLYQQDAESGYYEKFQECLNAQGMLASEYDEVIPEVR
jgi:hypothetical protein